MLTQVASAISLGAVYYALLTLIAGTVSIPLLTIITGFSLVMSRTNKGWGLLHKGIQQR